MKKILTFSAIIALFFASCNDYTDEYYGSDVSGKTNIIESPYIVDWKLAADSVTNSLIANYWTEYETGKGFFGYTPGDKDWSHNYWPQAHAMDVVLDAYLRVKGAGEKIGENFLILDGTNPEMTKEDYYRSFIDKWYDGIYEKNGNKFRNDFIDDMEWVTMTMIRVYEATGDSKYLTTAKQVYDDWIITEWSDLNGGGLLWSRSQTPSKNACSNAPGGIIAAWLYKHAGDADQKAKYLDDAKRIYEWQRAVLYNQETGQVYDNINNAGVVNEVSLTYNQGTFMGLAHELYMITKEPHYLTIALKTADYTMKNNVNDSKLLLRDEGTGDNGLFKGIFVRYLTTLANEADLDEATKSNIVRFITNNGVSLWTKGVSKMDDRANFLLCGTSWDSQPATSQLTTQSSGAMLIEAMNRLRLLKINFS